MVNREVPAAASRLPPLCVDLDGTLIRSDMLVESALDLVRNHPAQALCMPFWALRGRAWLKRRLANSCRSRLDPSSLPYNSDLVRFLRAEQIAGRHLALVTAADRILADRVAGHLGLFSEVFGSDGHRNLKGKTKLHALQARFGDRDFVYAGNSRSDLVIWKAAAGAILVDTPRWLDRTVAKNVHIERRFPANTNNWRELLRTMRLYQWVKNLLVFAPPLAAHALSDTATSLAALLVFFAFGLAASGLYIVNDLLDLPADRQHPRKRFRPFASGALPIRFGILGPCLIVIGVAVAASCGLPAAIVIACYVILSIMYSFWLKTRPLVDVFVLAALYSLRLFGGAVATDIAISVWLLSFSSFLFLALGLLKRDTEVSAQTATVLTVRGRRGYALGDAAILRSMGIASSFTSCLVLALYVDNNAAASEYANPKVLWWTVPLILFWQCRLWLATARGQMHDDPIVFASRDWVSWMVFIVVMGVFIVASAGGFGRFGP